MSALAVLAAVLLLFLLLGQVRVGGQAEFSDQGLLVWARLGRFRRPVVPWNHQKRPKTATPPKKAKPPNKPQSSPPKKNGQDQPPPRGEDKTKSLSPLVRRAGGALEYAQALLPVVLDAAGGVWRGLRVDRLELELTAGASDPGDAALVYGQANAALGALWLPLTRALRVKDGSARVRMDFDADRLTVYGRAAVSIRIGCLTRIALVNGIQGLKRALAVRKRRKRKQRKAA